jgi:PAS domain S-box-containing protein
MRTMREASGTDDRFRQAFDQSALGMALLGLDGRLLEVNPALCRLLGRAADELRGRDLHDFTHPDDVAIDVARAKQLRDGSVACYETEKRYRRGDGGMVWLLLTASLVRGAGGEPRHIVAHVQDVEPRRRTEDALARSDALYRAMAHHFPNGAVMLFDHQLRYRLADGAGLTDAGLAPHELEGRTSEEVFGRELADRLEPAYRAALAGAKAQVEVAVADRVYAVSTGPVPGPEGSTICGIAMAQDITQRVRAEQALRELVREKEVLLQEVHHRVKNNLQVIISLLSLQSRRIADAAALEMFRETQARVRSMALFHEQLYRSKDLSRIEMNGYLTSLAEGLRASMGNPQVAIGVEAETLELGVDVVIPCGLIANELITNSLKHAFPAGPGSIAITLREEADQLELCVADDGVPFPRDLEPPHARSLGLQLVHMLARQVHGTVVLERRPRGKAFRLRFPRSTNDLGRM